MSSPSFANTNRHPAPSPLSGWDSDRQDRAAFVNGPGVAVSQFTNHDRSGHWPPSDGRMNMGSNGLTHTVGNIDYDPTHCSIDLGASKHNANHIGFHAEPADVGQSGPKARSRLDIRGN